MDRLYAHGWALWIAVMLATLTGFLFLSLIVAMFVGSALMCTVADEFSLAWREVEAEKLAVGDTETEATTP